LATLKGLLGYKFKRKNISRKDSPIENNGTFDICKEQILQYGQLYTVSTKA